MSYHARTRHLLGKVCDVSDSELAALEFEPIHQIPVNPGGFPRGFGLWGPTGVGKSFRMAQVAADLMQRQVMFSPDPASARLEPNWLKWVNWPEQAEVMKRRVIGGGAGLSDWVEGCKRAKYLFFDDLGRERKGSRGDDDYAQGIFCEIVDARYRFSRATWWTSNRTPVEIAEFYPGHIASRILSAWPPYRVVGPDLRLCPPEDRPKPIRTTVASDARTLAAGVDR